MTTTLLRGRFWLTGAVCLALVLLVVVNKRVEYNQSLTSFFPDNDPDVRSYQRASATFGNDNVVFLTYDDPKLLTAEGMNRLAELAESVSPAHISAVTELQSLGEMPLFWQVDDRLVDLAKLPALARNLAVRALKASMATLGRSDSPLTVSGALRRADQAQIVTLRREITSHPLLRDTLVDASGTSTAVVVRLAAMGEQEPKETIRALRAAADTFARKHDLNQPFLVGPPVLLADGFAAIEEDGRRLAVVGLALIALVTLSVTHSLWWSIVPVLAGWTVWRAAETIMGFLGLKLSLSGGPLVAQIIVLTMPAASHLAIHFREEMRRNADRAEAARHTLQVVASPVVWTALTGAIGYGALLTSNVVPVFQFGAVLAACTLVATMLTMAIAPVAMLPPFPLEIPVRLGTSSRLASALNNVTRWVASHPAVVVLGVLAVVAPLMLGIFRLKYESNYINAFKPAARVAVDYRETEERLGGIGVVSVVLPARASLSMVELEAHRAVGSSIARLERSGKPAVAQVVSLATVLDPQGKLASLPAEQAEQALRMKLELIESAPQGSLLRSFWSPLRAGDGNSGWARLVLRVSEREPALEKESTFRAALDVAGKNTFFADQSRPIYVTGLSYLLTQTTRGVIDSSWITFVWSAVGILFMLTWAFRGPRLAALALLPSLLSVGFVLGVTGWMGVKLDLATALVASVALGLSVDDTFHCLLQYRRGRRTHPFLPSLLASYHVTGPGVVLSSLAVAIGFTVLRFSEFVPFYNFGTMVAVATLGSSLGNLVLLPACLALGHRWGWGLRDTTILDAARSTADPISRVQTPLPSRVAAPSEQSEFCEDSQE